MPTKRTPKPATAWEKTDPEWIKGGENVRAYKGKFTRIEAVATEDDDGGVYIEGIGYLEPNLSDVGWTFEVEKPLVLPHGPNTLWTDKSGRVLIVESGGTSVMAWNRTQGYYPAERNMMSAAGFAKRGPFERLYTMKEARDEIKRLAAEKENADV